MLSEEKKKLLEEYKKQYREYTRTIRQLYRKTGKDPYKREEVYTQIDIYQHKADEVWGEICKIFGYNFI